MNTSLSPLRRIGATLAIAGIAAFGSVALAPAASAAPAPQDGPISVIDRSDKNSGPDKFIVLEHGRIAVFFCDEKKPNKQHNKCEAPVVVDGPRF